MKSRRLKDFFFFYMLVWMRRMCLDVLFEMDLEEGWFWLEQ